MNAKIQVKKWTKFRPKKKVRPKSVRGCKLIKKKENYLENGFNSYYTYSY